MRKYPSAKDLAKLTKPGRYAIGFGAYLQISQSLTRSWVLRYRSGPRAVHMGLGPCSEVTQQEALDSALDARRMIRAGKDPLEEKRAAKRQRLLEHVHTKSFKECALAYIAAHESGWRGNHSRQQWSTSLAKYAYPKIGNLSVADIDLACVLSVLEPIWTVVPETARRVRNRIELVLDWASARRLRRGDNPARWKGLLESLLPEQRKANSVQHLAAMKYTEVGAFMRDLRAQDGLGARALEFTILCAARPGEAIGARWSEIDGEVWTIPPERMKSHREHRVPLSRRAIELLVALPRMDDYVFPAARKEPHPRTLLRVLERMGRDDVTTHGFRAAFRTWASERTAFPNDVIELALAHTVGNAVERAYRRGDLFEQRRRLMQDWSNYCDRQDASAGVTPIRTRTSA
jgi:integrase